MIEIAVNQIVVSIAGMLATGVIGFLLGLIKTHSKREKARVIIEKASARAHIKEAYEKYIINGQHMTIAAYEELLEEFEAYTILGGNGTAKAYMNEIKKIKPFLVTD